MLLTPVFEQLEHALTERVIELSLHHIPAYKQLQIPRAVLFERAYMTIHAFGQDLDHAEPYLYREHLAQGAYQRATQGLPIADFEEVVRIGYGEGTRTLKEHFAPNAEDQIMVLEKCFAVGQSGLVGLYNGYERARNDIISRQQATLSELSTPVVPIYEHILVVPIVGSVDAHRAQQFTERLLQETTAQNAQIVIIDITGVTLIDTAVAHHLLNTIRAARLLGTQVVLVGIRPEVAQTIVQLGIDLSGVTTLIDLQAGVTYALRMRGLRIVAAPREQHGETQ